MHGKITVHTTEESLARPVEFARADLAKAIEQDAGYEELAKAVNSVAEAEGARAVKLTYLHALLGGASREEALGHVIQQLVVPGPRDTWSGRANDGRRAFYDGILDVARDMRFWR